METKANSSIENPGIFGNKQHRPLLSLILLLLSLAGGIFYQQLFHNQDIGINLLLFNAFIILIQVFLIKVPIRTFPLSLIYAGTLISAVTAVMHNNLFSFWVNLGSLILLISLPFYPEVKSLKNALLCSLEKTIGFYRVFGNIKTNISFSKGAGKTYKILRLIFIPIIILIVFVIIYYYANPYFASGFDKVAWWIQPLWNRFINWFANLPGIWMFIWGVFVCILMFFPMPSSAFARRDSLESDNMARTRKKSFRLFPGMYTGLKREYLSSLFLMAALNILILILNLTDFFNVWLFFEWDGQTLKQFVHEGTWLLVVSIFISMAISLYIFRGNLNFYSKNRYLRLLTKIWIYQNLFMTLSVGFRNFWYCYYFNLAYLRIGVFFFLIAVVIGLITIILKIRHKHSSSWLLKTNAIAIYIIFCVICLFNWDNFISSTNFKRADKAYLHRDFLLSMSNSTLPILWENKDKLNVPMHAESELLIFIYKEFDTVYEDDNYITLLERKTLLFKQEMDNRSWKEWNLADHLAYRRLEKKAWYGLNLK